MKTNKNSILNFLHRNYIAPTIVGIITGIISGVALFKISNFKKDIDVLNITIQQQNTTIDTLNATIRQIYNFHFQNIRVENRDSSKVKNQINGGEGNSINHNKYE